MRTVAFQLSDDVLVHLLNIIDAVVATGYTRLIANHDDRNIRPVQRGNRVKCTINKLDAVNGTDIPAVLDNRAVSVEKHSWPAHILAPVNVLANKGDVYIGEYAM